MGDRQAARQPLKVAYVVSRFPHFSETFILRELNAVNRRPGVQIELFSLFPAANGTVHPAARPWLKRLRRCGATAALRGLGWWLARRPLRLLGSLALMARGHARRPRTLIRALATVPVAAAHARTLARLEVGHVHAHYATYPALAAWLSGRLTGIPYSFTAHAHDIFLDRSHLARKLADACFAVAVSEYNRELLTGLGGRAATPVHVVRCGIDAAAFRYRQRELRPTGPVRVLCVASMQEYKGHRVLLEALAGGGPVIGRIELELVGEGVLRGSLERLARTLGISDRVRFHGALTEPEVAAALEAADVFVLPSVVARDGQMEGVPVALMEALACGLPTVATRLSGVPELVRHGRTGILAEPGDAAALRAALVSTIADPAGARERAEAGRRLVESEFDLGISARRLARLFSTGGAER